MKRIIVVLASLAGLASAAGSATAEPVNILVPAYGNPCCDDGMWSSLIATAGTAGNNFQLEVIFNPASGPGLARDPNYLTDVGSGPLASLRDAGGSIVGYVSTSNALRPIADAKADIDAYLTGIYAGYVNGLFFDEMSNDLANVGYYRELRDYAASIRTNLRTIGNPGTPYLNNLSGQTAYGAADYVATFDTLLSFENTAAAYANDYVSFAYLEGLDPTKIAHVVHTQGAWNASLIDTAAGRGAGYIYFTDDVMANPYDRLPTYWTAMVADVRAHNVAAVPEPSTWLALACGLGLLAWRRRSAG